jgi:hypothetical protein
MVKVKHALFVAVPLFCATLALAQSDNAPGHFRPDPAVMHKEMCDNRPAMAAAKLAFVETRLELTDAQKPLFNKWRQTLLDAAAKGKAACLSRTPGKDGEVNILEQQDRQVAMLTARLQVLQNSHAALKALYDSLTPAQRMVLDHPRHRHGGEHRGWRGEAH